MMVKRRDSLVGGGLGLLELLASGMTIEEIIESHPDLERDDPLAALEFGALVSAQRRVPLGAA
jgi:uncharacterized protein (DUF433 family)